jgi:hypothetical protein
MPREVTLFTDDGQWAVVVTSWQVHLVLYHDIGIRVRVYRLGVPGTWGSELGPWAHRGPWFVRGPWKARGPWGGAWGPWRADGPWARGPWKPHERFDAGPWGGELTRSWIETPAESIGIRARFLGPRGGEVIREVSRDDASFLRASESGFGLALERLDARGARVRIESLHGTVRVVAGGVTLTGEVSTRSDEHRRE